MTDRDLRASQIKLYAVCVAAGLTSKDCEEVVARLTGPPGKTRFMFDDVVVPELAKRGIDRRRAGRMVAGLD